MIVIANCLIKNRMIPEHHLNRILEDCRDIGIEEKDICLNFSPLILQAGRPFELIVNLYLPESLPLPQVQQIASGLRAIMARRLSIRIEDIALTTTLTQIPATDK